MKIEVLLSCMHQTDIKGLICRSNIQTDTVVVNQTDYDSTDSFEFINNEGAKCTVRVFNTTERGLSRSRNMALRNAHGDICIISDDDEVFEDDYNIFVKEYYVKYPLCGVLCFEVRNRTRGRNFGIFKEQRLNKWSILKICSVQITFNRRKVLEYNIKFNEHLGAGVTQAGGEEHKFLKDCLNAGLTIMNIPVYMTAIDNSESSWWKGFSKQYFYDKGISSRTTMGLFWASVYAVYTLIFKYKYYRKNCSFFGAASSLFKGIFAKPV